MHSPASSDPEVWTSIVAELSIVFSDSGGDAGLWLGCSTSPTMENTEFAQNSLEFSCGSGKNLLYKNHTTTNTRVGSAGPVELSEAGCIRVPK